MYDIVIKKGRVIDTYQGIDKQVDLYIKNGVFVTPNEEDDRQPPEKTIDASGCIVTPGLIDAHMHVFEGGSGDLGAGADSICLPSGVTTAVDGGSTGPLNFESMYRTAMVNSRTNIKALLNAAPYGVMLPPREEIGNPATFDYDRIERIYRKYSDQIVGLKIRQHVDVCQGYGIKPLIRTREIAAQLKEKGYRAGITLHFSQLEEGLEVCDIVNNMSENDVFTHMYQTIGKTIIGEDGKVLDCLKEARKRGVLFDSGIGRIHFSLKNIWAAFEDGFMPDIISTDIIKRTAYRKPAVSILRSMSMFLNLGMPLQTIIKCVTETPARSFGLLQEAGTLRPGCSGDAAVFQIWDKKVEFADLYGNSFTGEKLIVPMAVVKSGAMAFQQMFFD